MCRCLMAISAVSQHGPNPQAGPRRPDRSVSLPDPRETAAEMMGGLGNLPLKRLQKQRDDLIDRHERLKSDSPNAPFNQELDELLEAIDEVERQIRELDPPPPPPPVEAFDLDDPAARKAALAKWGAPHLGAVPDLPPGTHAMTGTGGHLPGGGGFDFDEFDRAISEGVSAAEQNPWDLVEDPRTGELVERSDLAGAPSVSYGDWAVTEAGDSLEQERERARARWPQATPFDQRVADATGRALALHDPGDVGADGILDAVRDEMAEDDPVAVEQSFWDMGYDRALDLWRVSHSPGFLQEGAAEPSADDEFSHESRAVNLPSGLPGFQSPSASPGSPGFQAPPVRERPGGFRTPAVGAKPGGFQGAPPSVQSMLTHMASGERGRIGRSHPEGPTPPFEPLPELTEEERKRGKEAIEKIRRDNPDVLNPESTMDAAFLPGMFAQAAEQESQGYFGGVGDIVESVFEAVPDIDPRTAAAVAMAVAAAIAAGTGVGGPLVPPLLAGGAMLSSQ